MGEFTSLPGLGLYEASGKRLSVGEETLATVLSEPPEHATCALLSQLPSSGVFLLNAPKR
jgi:hypothetical protein